MYSFRYKITGGHLLLGLRVQWMLLHLFCSAEELFAPEVLPEHAGLPELFPQFHPQFGTQEVPQERVFQSCFAHVEGKE